MEIFIAIVAIICGVIGILGSIIPALPGPPISWVGMLLLYFWGGTNGAGDPMSLTLLLVMLGVTVAVTVIDYFVPIYLTKATGGSKYASWGTMIGMLLGAFFSPIGLIIGSFLGAFIFELIFAKQSTKTSLKSAWGAFLGFLLGTGIKLIACGIMMYYIVVYI